MENPDPDAKAAAAALLYSFREPIPYTCVVCGASFKAIGARAKYCSDDCRQSVYRDRRVAKLGTTRKRPYKPWSPEKRAAIIATISRKLPKE